MMHTESPFVPVPLRRIATMAGGDGHAAVIRLHGEHDASNAAVLSRALAVAAAGSDADLVVDLSHVEFMDASTIGALVGARNVLRSRSRDLVLRSPTRAATRLLGICGLSDLIDPATAPSGALATWVAVPQTVAADPSSRADPSSGADPSSTADPSSKDARTEQAVIGGR